jgi:hypothetical protein
MIMPAVLSTFHDGSVKDSFGLLSKDRHSVSTKNFLSFIDLSGLTRSEIAKELRVNRTSLYQKEMRLSREEIEKKVIPLVIAADFAFAFFKNKQKARSWIMSPNTYFFGKSPFQICLQGDGRVVVELLSEWMGEKDGQAF